MDNFLIIIIFSTASLLQINSLKHITPTFFWRHDENGTLIDRNSPDFDELLKGVQVYNEPPENVTVEPIKLQVWPEYVDNGDKVTILWSGITNAQSNDWFGYYCPFYDDFKHQLDWFYLHSVPGHKYDTDHKHPGYGHATWTVYNMREECHFRYYRMVITQLKPKKKWYYVLGATSNTIKFHNGGRWAPTQGHIAYTTNETEMRVMWVSGQVEHPPLVRYGKTKQMTHKEYRHTIRTYDASDLCDGRAQSYFWHPGITYDFLLQGLQPDTTYYYAYGTEKYMSKMSNFTTAPVYGTQKPFKFITYGDMGVYSWPRSAATSHLVMKDIREHDIKFVHHIGDISYAVGWAYVWDQWGKLIEPQATLVPYMVGIGNHEYDHRSGGIGRDPSGIKTDGGWKPKWFNGGSDSGGECAVPVHKRYHMPDNGNSVFWYSYDYGMVHMIMMSTEHDFSSNSTQYKWLENDLKELDRNKTKWIVIGGHRPMYNSQKYYSDFVVAEHMKLLFEDLLYKYRVDLAVWGHYHSYERTCKVYKEKCVKDGITHITIGTAGYWREQAAFYNKTWSIKRDTDYGYGRVTVANASALLFEYVINRHDGDTVGDRVWIYK